MKGLAGVFGDRPNACNIQVPAGRGPLVFYILRAFLIKQLFHSRLLDIRCDNTPKKSSIKRK